MTRGAPSSSSGRVDSQASGSGGRVAQPIYATSWERYKKDLPPDQALTSYTDREAWIHPSSGIGLSDAPTRRLSRLRSCRGRPGGPEIDQERARPRSTI